MDHINAGDGLHASRALKLEPGQYYARMARRMEDGLQVGLCPGAYDEPNVIAIAEGQLEVLTRQLASICQTVHPADDMLDTYGHEIRNLLILACTEIEAHWRGILNANRVKKDRYTTADYVSLLDAMRLDKFSVNFPRYPWLRSRRPFEGWTSAAPTQSLRWYDAYNAVKHDRENSFSRATLGHAFDAVSACAIMLLAQFGFAMPGWQNSFAMQFCKVEEFPTWKPMEFYIANYKPNEDGVVCARWDPVPYPF